MADNNQTIKILQKISDQLKIMSDSGGSGVYAKSSVGGSMNADGTKSNLDWISKMLDGNLKKQKDYLAVVNKINSKENELYKIKSSNKKLEEVSIKYAKNLADLEKIRTDKTGKYNAAQKEGRKIMLDNLKKENKALLEQYKVLKEIDDLEGDKAKIKSEYNEKHKGLIKVGKAVGEMKDNFSDIVTNNKSLNKLSNAFSGQLANITGISGGILGFFEKTLTSLLEQDSIMSKLTSNYALSKKESNSLKINLTNAAVQTNLIGVGVADLVKMQGTYTDELGRSVMLSEDGMVKMAQMGVATGLGAEGAAQMASQMELFGMSAESSVNRMQDIVTLSKKNGLSSSVMAKRLSDNLKIANSYTFKDGLKGVVDMTVYSSKFRINMADIASFADKVSNPEGAIKAAASLQVLGGAFSNLADPLKLLDQGINDMEGLTKTYNNMLDGIGQINKKTGEISINGYDRLRVKAAAEAMGVSYENMMETARTKAKRGAIESNLNISPVLKGADEDTKNLIASLAQYKEGKGFEINVGGKNKMLTSLSKEDIDLLQPKNNETNLQTIAVNTLGVTDILKNTIAVLMADLVKTSMPALINVTTQILNIAQRITGIANGNAKGAIPGASSSQVAQYGAGIPQALGGLKAGKMADLGFGARALKIGAGKLPWIGGAVSGIADYLSGGSASHAISVGAGSGIGSILGGALGSLLLPGVGTAGGAMLGGWAGEKLGGLLNDAFTSANDLIIPSNGKPIKLDSKDQVIAAKPGGAIDQVLAPSSNVKKTYGGVEPSYSSSYITNSNNGSLALNIQGSITLNGGGSSTKISASELVKDRQFLRELTRIIGNQMNRDSNGGKFTGSFNNNSF